MTISNKNFTQELMERLHDWALDRTDNSIEIKKEWGKDYWVIWIFKFDYRGGIGIHITDDNFEAQDFDALLEQKRETSEKEQYEALKKKFENA